MKSVPVVTETSIERLARWANALNGWEWPDDLPSKPDDWDTMPDFVKDDPNAVQKSPIISAIVDWITSRKIDGDMGKEIMRWHHLNNMKHSPEYFELWWAVSSGNDRHDTLERLHDYKNSMEAK